MAELTNDDVVNKTPFLEEVEKRGIDADFLIKRLKRAFDAKQTTNIKIKGAINPDDLPKGYKAVATSGYLTYDKNGKQLCGDGETLIRFNEWDMGIQEGARKDAHKLRGDYPATNGKMELSGTIILKTIGRTQKAKTAKEDLILDLPFQME